MSWQLSGNNYKYQTKEMQKYFDYNVLDFGARHYDPTIARWTVTDPAGQYFNLYYAMGGNPVSIVDPVGMWSNKVTYASQQNCDNPDLYKRIGTDGFDKVLGGSRGGGLSGMTPQERAQEQLQSGTAIVSIYDGAYSGGSGAHNMYAGVYGNQLSDGTYAYQNANTGNYVATSNPGYSIHNGSYGHYETTSGSIVAANKNWENIGATSDYYFHKNTEDARINYWAQDQLWFVGEWRGAGGSWGDESGWWSNPITRNIVRDDYFIGWNSNVVPTVGGGISVDLHLMTRGPDAGFHLTKTPTIRVGFEGAEGLHFGSATALTHDPKNILFNDLLGNQIDFSLNPKPRVGFGVGEFASLDKHFSPTWFGTYASFGIGIGFSIGYGQTLQY